MVFSWFCFAYLRGAEGRRSALSRSKAALRKGGRVLLSYPVRRGAGSPASSTTWLSRVAARLLGGTDSEVGDQFNVSGSAIRPNVFFSHSFEPEEIEDEVRRAGFTITSHNRSEGGVGVMALAGIVVRNGILLVEFTDLLRAQGMELREAIAEASKTRMTPVLLTAMAATLGLIPLAVGLNIDFVTLFTEFNPHIFFGGDNVAFWGPLSWTMIFGLIFGTFLTLFLVPTMYLMVARLKEHIFGVKPAPVPGKDHAVAMN